MTLKTPDVRSTNLSGQMNEIFIEFERPMSAAQMTKELSARGWLPPLWTVIDVADHMKEWFSPGGKP